MFRVLLSSVKSPRVLSFYKRKTCELEACKRFFILPSVIYRSFRSHLLSSTYKTQLYICNFCFGVYLTVCSKVDEKNRFLG